MQKTGRGAGQADVRSIDEALHLVGAQLRCRFWTGDSNFIWIFDLCCVLDYWLAKLTSGEKIFQPIVSYSCFSVYVIGILGKQQCGEVRF